MFLFRMECEDMNVYVAVDIGASSGRLILAQIVDHRLQISEVHRFTNGFTKSEGHDRWQIDHIVKEIFTGLEKVKQRGISHVYLGIDTWAVDYVLVDSSGNKIHDPISYRDSRTTQAVAELTSNLPKEYLYEKTGIQFQDFNTLYQLYREDQADLKNTAKILMIPDYLGYVLTGNAVSEVTNASTTQMLNLREGLFDEDLLAEINVDQSQFPSLTESGTFLGKIKQSWMDKYNLPETTVITVATHDTASAVVGTPGVGDNWAFLSSGTWSLLGAELNTPVNNLAAFRGNYTNEWGAYGTYRFLKNIMGLWIVQSLRRENANGYNFPDLVKLAEQETPFRLFIDVNDPRFLNPTNMMQALQNYAAETHQYVPQTISELLRAVYDNLSLCYAAEIQQLSKITGKHLTTLNIVGGGSNVALMNQATSNLAQIKVVAGPDEATAIGNVLVQAIATEELPNVKEARAMIAKSFTLKTFEPETKTVKQFSEILSQYQRFIIQQKS